MVARRGGRFFDGDLERRGVKQQNRATTKAYTDVLARVRAVARIFWGNFGS